MLTINVILFSPLIFIHLYNLVSCYPNGNSTEPVIIEPEFRSDSVHEFERLFDQISIKTLEVIEKNLQSSNVSRRKRGSNVFSESNSNFHKWYNDSLNACRKSLDNLIDLNTLKKMFNDVYYIDEPNGIHLKGDITFDSLSVSGTLKAPDVRSEDGFSHGRKFGTKFTTIAHSLKTIESETVRLNNLLRNAMKTDGDQQVSGNITFSHAYFDCGDDGCDIKSIETSTLNGRNVKNLSSRIIRLNQNLTLTDTYNFSNLIVDNLDVEFINSVTVADIVTRDGNHDIPGEINFENSVRVSQLNVIKTVNGYPITRDSVLTTTDSQVITSPVILSHEVNIKDLNVAGTLPQIGLDVNTFLSNVVQIGDNRPITGVKTFYNVFADHLIVEGNTINGFNLSNLHRHLLTRNDSQTIHALVTVDDLIVNGDIYVDRINGNKVEEMFVPRNKPTVIKGDKIFTGPVHIKTMQVDGYINERQIINRSLGLLLKKGSQVITGRKDFRDIEVKNLTLLHGNIGPLNFDILKNKAERMIQGGKNRQLSGPIHLEDITVEGRINGIKLDSLMNDYLKVNQTIIPNVNLNIKRANFMKSLQCKRINGLKFPDDFITTNTDQTFNGTIHMSSNLVVTSSLNLTRVNGYEVNAALWDSLTASKDQKITAHKTINGNLYVKNLNVTSFNNINMKDLVLLNGNGIITIL